MSCNNNVAPLLDKKEDITCDNGCMPKDINIICRKMIIPFGQDILGVQGDNNSVHRIFILPDVTESGISLQDKNFFILFMNEKKEQWKIPIGIENIEILDNYIKIRWNVGQNEMALQGVLKVSIEAIGDNFKWQTYTGEFRINPSIGENRYEINPPLNLEEKIVTPSNETIQIIPSEGYNGLKSVTIVGDKNLTPENIKKGVSIFGVTGIYE